MTVTVGQLREDGVFGLRLVALGHNLERGAAGGTLRLAELAAGRLEGQRSSARLPPMMNPSTAPTPAAIP